MSMFVSYFRNPGNVSLWRLITSSAIIDTIMVFLVILGSLPISLIHSQILSIFFLFKR